MHFFSCVLIVINTVFVLYYAHQFEENMKIRFNPFERFELPEQFYAFHVHNELEWTSACTAATIIYPPRGGVNKANVLRISGVVRLKMERPVFP